MGDLRQHASIYYVCVHRLHKRRIRAAYDYMYIGNFLTDVSQFVDPFACMSAKKIIRRKAYATKGVSPFDPFISKPGLTRWVINDWLDKLLGWNETPASRIGVLSEYLRHIARAFTHFVFSDDLKAKQRDMILPPGLTLTADDLSFLKFLPAAVVDRIFDQHFSQYYPHEHLDMPPPEMNGGTFSGGLFDRAQASGLISYLETYRNYLTEEFFRLDRDWRQLAQLPETDDRIKNLFIRLDRLLHPIEDFFYHSNYLEIFMVRHGFGGRTLTGNATPEPVDIAITDEFLSVLERDLKSSGQKVPAAELNRWLRKLCRRLRYPVNDWAGRPSKEKSESSVNCVYTGGFAGNDIFHTVSGALKGLEEMLKPIILGRSLVRAVRKTPAQSNAHGQLVLVRALLDSAYRVKLADAAAREEAAQLHRQQLVSRAYHTAVEDLYARGYLNASGRDALFAALAVDFHFQCTYTRCPAIGEFLLTVLAQAQAVDDASHRVTEARDAGRIKPETDDTFATNNGATAEQIGTHSLMAKDSGHGLPLHREAQALARFSTYLLTYCFLDTVREPGVRLDYHRVIGRLVRFPQAGGWQSKILKFFRDKGNDPDFEDIGFDPKQFIQEMQLSSSSTVDQRIDSFQTKSNLEQRYRKLEEKADDGR